MKRDITIVFFVVVFFLAACSPDALKEYTPTANGAVSDLYGTWNGLSVTQRDIGAENKGFPYKSEDITAPLGFTNVKLTLNGSGTTPSTFSFAYGSAVPFFKYSSGNWKVDNTAKVGKVYLINSAGTDTMTMVLGSYQDLLNNKMKFTQTKTLLGQPAIVYEYQFSK